MTTTTRGRRTRGRTAKPAVTTTITAAEDDAPKLTPKTMLEAADGVYLYTVCGCEGKHFQAGTRTVRTGDFSYSVVSITIVVSCGGHNAKHLENVRPGCIERFTPESVYTVDYQPRSAAQAAP